MGDPPEHVLKRKVRADGFFSQVIEELLDVSITENFFPVTFMVSLYYSQQVTGGYKPMEMHDHGTALN